MKNYEKQLGALGTAVRNLAIVMKDLPPFMDGVIVDAGKFERMKNCVNCEHQEVCLVVAQRKAKKANDYSACSKWKLAEE